MHPSLARTLGRSARSAREALSLTQEDIAERVGISTEFYARMERGHALPSVKTLVRMSSALGVTLDELVGKPKSAARAAESSAAWRSSDPPELRKLIRRLRKAKPRTVALISALLRELERS